jgi:hypothetical protein
VFLESNKPALKNHLLLSADNHGAQAAVKATCVIVERQWIDIAITPLL